MTTNATVRTDVEWYDALDQQDDDTLLARLTVVADDLTRLQSELDEAFRERLNIYRVLAHRGLTQQRIAEPAKVSANAVGYALHTHGRYPTDAD